MLEKLEKASWKEIYTWFAGACITMLGIGAYLAEYLRPYAFLIILFGLIVHLPAMYKIYSRR